MTTRSFVHLHCHSHYSLLDGASRIPELVAHTKGLGMNALALTDHGNLYGAIEFYRECKAAGINPIVGYEAYVAPQSRLDRTARKRGDAGFHLTLLAQNATGFKNLVRLSSIAFLDGHYYVPRIDKELLSAHHEGLICLSGCASGEFSELILLDKMDEATELARWFSKQFGKRFYIEIQNNGLQIQERCAEGAIAIADKLGLPLVATSDAHYLTQSHTLAHDVLLCINTGKLLGDENRMRYGSDQFYVRAPEEMYRLFPSHEDAVERSQEIADSVAIELDFGTRHFPVFEPPQGLTAEQHLRELCQDGLKKRYGTRPPQAARDRLQLELDIICRMGFASYFLIVRDFVRFALEQGIPAGARGSACGALVSYVLYLSHVDPLDYDLLFERFLDPNRSEAPDIDIDFCQDRRDEVIQYVKRKYGEDSVAQIATFGTLAARAAIKDVGRVLDVPLDRVNFLSNLVPKVLNISLEDSLKQSSELRQEYDSDPQVKKLIDIAKALEGTNRNVGTHAAGVVIANGPIIDYVPVQRMVRKGEDGSKSDEPVITTQWVMGDLEKAGMLKMDFLGLRTLTLLKHAVDLIERHRGEKIDIFRLPMDDPDTFAMLQRGEARGVFQFEGEGIRELLKRMRPDGIRDIIASTALYRPGPLQGGMVDMYIDCKHGRQKPEYAHPVMEEVLAETYGVMVYQEQVMRILNRLGGIELSSAYACIKAISKKKTEIIEQRKSEFVKGAIERGVAEATARDIFEKIEKFGGYGFNKAHSAAYALVSYQTAYLKAHYKPEFMAALLTSEIEDNNKRDIMVEHINDARKNGVKVLPPCVNRSAADFTVSGDDVFFGLTAIKGVGRGAAEDIVRARMDGGGFRDVFDFCERIDHKVVPRVVLEKLIKAGAMDCFGKRSQMMQVWPRAMQAAAESQEDRRRGQMNLFGDGAATSKNNGHAALDALPDIEEWHETEKLKHEKEVLDFYLSSHPLTAVEKDLQRFATHQVGKLLELANGTEVLVGGMIGSIRFMNTKSARNGNSRFVRCTIEDFTGTIECLMWPDDLVKHKDDFVDDRVCFFRGILDRTRDRPVLVLNRVLAVEQVQREQTRGLWLLFTLGLNSERDVEAIGRILRRTPGNCPVHLLVRDAGQKNAVLKLGPEFAVNPTSFSIGDMEVLLGAGNVKFA